MTPPPRGAHEEVSSRLIPSRHPPGTSVLIPPSCVHKGSCNQTEVAARSWVTEVFPSDPSVRLSENPSPGLSPTPLDYGVFDRRFLGPLVR